MRRLVCIVSGLLVAGCSGSWFGTYVHDTTRFPGRIPNQPAGDSANQQKVMAVNDIKKPVPLTLESASIWPGPPKNVPSLQDLQRQQNAQMAAGTYSPHQMAPDLPVLPGYPVTPPDELAKTPNLSFPTGVVSGVDRKRVGTIGGAEASRAVPEPNSQGAIVVPNGDGTSTVISPDGTVSTQPAPK